ncbi:transposase [Pedobacter petrophilus]
MPNHFHFMVLTRADFKANDLNNAMGVLLRSYTRAINLQEKRTGSLFQQKTKAKELIDMNDNNAVSYLAICAHYIHQNPVRAGLTKSLNQWQFSSYLVLLGLRNGTLCNQELFFALSGISKDDFIEESEAMLNFKRNEWKP